MTDPAVFRARLCAGVSAALFAAVLLAGSLRSAAVAPPASPTEQDMLAAFGQELSAVRREEIDQLLLLSADADEDLRREAQARILELRRRMEQEAVVAEVLRARGYDAPVVTVTDACVNVTVRAQELTEREAGVILELAARETGMPGGSIKIIPIN